MYLICRLCFTDEGYVEPIFKIEKSLVETIKNILPFEVRIYYFDYSFVLKKIVFLQIEDLDGWPAGLCEDCKSKLVFTRNFINVCTVSQDFLVEQFADNVDVEEQYDDVEDEGMISDQELDFDEYEREELGWDENKSSEENKKFNVELYAGPTPKIEMFDSDLDDEYGIPIKNENFVFELYTGQKKRKIGAGPLECLICHKLLKNKKTLSRHKLTHAELRPFNREMTEGTLECPICHRLLTNKKSLHRHKLTHTEVRPYNREVSEAPQECLICHKFLKNKKTLRSHRLTHTELRSFKCELCSNTFKANTSLTAHKKRHYIPGPFSCEICKCFFSKKFKMDLHNQMKHFET